MNRVLAPAVAAAVLLLVAGCAPEPAPAPTSDAAATRSAAPSPSPDVTRTAADLSAEPVDGQTVLLPPTEGTGGATWALESTQQPLTIALDCIGDGEVTIAIEDQMSATGTCPGDAPMLHQAALAEAGPFVLSLDAADGITWEISVAEGALPE